MKETSSLLKHLFLVVLLWITSGSNCLLFGCSRVTAVCLLFLYIQPPSPYWKIRLVLFPSFLISHSERWDWSVIAVGAAWRSWAVIAAVTREEPGQDEKQSLHRNGWQK